MPSHLLTPSDALAFLLRAKFGHPDEARYRALYRRILGHLDTAFSSLRRLAPPAFPTPPVVDESRTVVGHVQASYRAAWQALRAIDPQNPGLFALSRRHQHQRMTYEVDILLDYLDTAERELPLVEFALRYSEAFGELAQLDIDPDFQGVMFADWYANFEDRPPRLNPRVILVRMPESPDPVVYTVCTCGHRSQDWPAKDVPVAELVTLLRS